MPFLRMGRPGLLGTVARTAVIAGTAQMTSNALDRHAERRAMEDAEYARQTTPRPPDAVAGEDLVSRLASLARLRDDGTLSEVEFQIAKQKLLRS